jgi:O-antigen/teichoic acid export membrane protein
LSVFVAVLTGLQDFTFTGILSVIRSTLTAAIIIALLLNDAGLYALAAGAAIPALVTLVASAVRVGVIAPDLLKGWPRPTWAGLTSLFGSSVGAWLGGFGWKLIAASNSLVIAFLGHPEWIAVYVCTARLGGMLQQMSWVVPDSGLVGLAQLSGEGRPARMREVTTSLLRLYVILSGLVTLAILAVNPAFVRWWVGADYFGGITLNALLAAGAVVASFVHGVSVVPSVLGRRLEVGTAVIVNGLVQLALAVPLGARYGLNGIALASILAAIVTTLPAGVVLLGRTTGLETRWLIGGVIGTWSLRAAPLVAVAAVLGFWGRSLSVFLVAALAAPIGLAYVWRMRPLYRDFPLDPRFRRLLATLGLAPPVPEPAVGAPEPG